MPAEAVEVVRHFQAATLEARRQGDLALTGGRAFLDPDVTVRVSLAIPYGGLHHGIDAYLDILEAVPRSRTTLAGPDLTFIDADDHRVVVLLRFDAKWLATGRVTQVDMLELFTVRDGRIVALAPYYADNVEILEATDGVRVMPLPSPEPPATATLPPAPDRERAHADAVRRVSDRLWQGSGERDHEHTAESVADLCQDVTVRMPSSLPYGGTFHGHDGLATLVKRWRAAWRPVGPAEVTLMDGGDAGLLTHTVTTAELCRTGERIPVEAVTVFGLRDGLISSITPYHWDLVPLVSALRAAGQAVTSGSPSGGAAS